MEPLHLYVTVPIAGFRVAQAREYWESYPCPPPSTVYGMLLSLVGEENRLAHQGAEIAFALLSQPQPSVVLRTTWRIKDRKAGLGREANVRPDFQELLSDIRLSVWIKSDREEKDRSLCHRLSEAFDRKAKVKRFGGLCLGESSHLVNEIRPWRDKDHSKGYLLLVDHKQGNLSLPVWPDHVGSKGTRWEQFQLQVGHISSKPFDDRAWVEIKPP